LKILALPKNVAKIRFETNITSYLLPLKAHDEKQNSFIFDLMMIHHSVNNPTICFHKTIHLFFYSLIQAKKYIVSDCLSTCPKCSLLFLPYYWVSQKTRNPYKISKYPNSFKTQYLSARFFWFLKRSKILSFDWVIGLWSIRVAFFLGHPEAHTIFLAIASYLNYSLHRCDSFNFFGSKSTKPSRVSNSETKLFLGLASP